MIKRRTKALYYALLGPFMSLNGKRYRLLSSPRKHSQAVHKVHLGPGQQNYLNGWINVDANFITARCDVWADLNDPLPFNDESIDAFYSHHVVEHLNDMEAHFKEVFRCLKNGGIYRLGGPNGDAAIKKFIENDKSWFGDFPDKRKSIGGRLENFIFCRKEHVTLLTYSFLEELLTEAGFVNVVPVVSGQETQHPSLFSECLEKEIPVREKGYPHSLMIEATKPV